MGCRPPLNEISVVYPAYNEENNVLPTLNRSLSALRRQFERFEIIVINDGSSDNTGLLIDDLSEKIPELKVLHNSENLGSGASMLRGMKTAKFSYVVNNGMDYPFDLEDLEKLLPHMAKVDVAVASRNGRPGYSIYRLLLSFMNLLLIKCLFKIRLRDFNFIQIYKKKVIDSCEIDSVSPGFVAPEMIIRAGDRGFKIKEFSIDYHPRKSGKSVMGHPKIVMSSLKEMVHFWFKRTRGLSA